jgi:hypothetical protein
MGTGETRRGEEAGRGGARTKVDIGVDLMVTVELGNIIAVHYIPFFSICFVYHQRFLLSVICLGTVFFCTHIVDEFVAKVFTAML